MSILGNRVIRVEDPALLTVGGSYIDDLSIPGAAFVTFVRSTVAHARLAAVDVSEALTAPGVLAVVTAADLDIASVPIDMPMLPSNMPRPLLAAGVVRYVGEPIAAVITEERYQGEDAAELVVVDYDPLPVIVDVETALKDEVLLFPEVGTNVCVEFPGEDISFDDCEVVVNTRMINNKVAPCPLEVRVAASLWTEDGRLHHWASSQGAHGVKAVLAETYGLDPSLVHVVSPDVGGGFGAKAFPYSEESLCPWLARHVGRPVKWVETRSESMLGLGHGRGQLQDVEIGGTRDGRVLAYRVTIVQDVGAYPRVSAFLPMLTKMMLTGTYVIPAASCASRSVVTNTVPMMAYRGAGRPEAAAAIERAMDLFATEIGMDPAEVRRRNLIGPDVFPFTTVMGTTYDSGRYEAALDMVLEAAGYAELRAEQARRRAAGATVQLGIGLSVYVEITGLGGGTEYGHVEMLPTGKARVLTGSSPHGQGHETSWAMLVAERLAIPIEDVEVLHGDTDVVPQGGLTGGSRSLQISGTTLWQAAGDVVEKARALAAQLLEADPADVVLADGRFHVAGTPAVARTWADLAVSWHELEGSPLDATGAFNQAGGTFPSGAHIAVVEVDTETGKVVLQRLVAVDDCGRVLNPLIVEGQVHGGLAQGAAQALFEEVVYDAEGNPLTGNLADYTMISAAELPSFETFHIETDSPLNELGAKGIGESGSIGSTPAVQNAVVDALSHLGVRHVQMPTTPQRVWEAITQAAGSH